MPMEGKNTVWDNDVVQETVKDSLFEYQGWKLFRFEVSKNWTEVFTVGAKSMLDAITYFLNDVYEECNDNGFCVDVMNWEAVLKFGYQEETGDPTQPLITKRFKDGFIEEVKNFTTDVKAFLFTSTVF